MMNIDDDDSLYRDDQSLFEGEDDDMLQSAQGSARLAREDIRLMNVVRAIVILCLLTFAVISAESVFITSLIAEQENFSDAYNDASKVLTNMMYERISTKIWIANSFAKELALSLHASDAVSPYVSFNHFADRCKGPLHLGQSSSITFSPFIEPNERSRWEGYAATVYPLIEHDSLLSRFESEAMEDSPTENIGFRTSKRTIEEGIYHFVDGKAENASFSAEGYFPLWQRAPGTANEHIVGTMFNLLSSQARAVGLRSMLKLSGTAISQFLYSDLNREDYARYSTPRSIIYSPVYQTGFNGTLRTVGAVGFEFPWEPVFASALKGVKHPLVAVLENHCDSTTFSYKIDGEKVSFMGEGDWHPLDIDGYTKTNSSYDDFEYLFLKDSIGTAMETDICGYRVAFFPTSPFKKYYVTNRPDIYRGIVLAVFLSVVAVFWCYDGLIERRQGKVIQEAEKSDAIVRSLFPSTFRDRLYQQSQAAKKQDGKENWKNPEVVQAEGGIIETPKNRLKTFMSKSPEDQAVQGVNISKDALAEPIADLIPQTTIMFADISGFTAWSSEREPSQVFTLLESIYRQMDRAAKKLGVFKVETVGDCYVAATGIPDPQPNFGAETMIRFARTCLIRMNILTKELESQLGPGTAELSLRIGIHSGPVTAGVLRGQKARFQLFGDTMNTASRMESTGQRNKIQISPQTAEILMKCGHSDWLEKRHDLVQVKGKGSMQTYWLILKTSSQSRGSTTEGSEATGNIGAKRKSKAPKRKKKDVIWAGTELDSVLGLTEIDDDIQRLIKWNVDVLLILLKRVVTARVVSGASSTKLSPEVEKQFSSNGLVLDDFQLVINMPNFDAEVASRMYNEDVELIPEVKKELSDYVAAIASGYKRNSFHNFEHASHVILSANKLLKRIMAADDCKPLDNALTCKELHNHTYGIGTDPLTQFAVVFSALIHDVGHEGVPNGVLENEHPLLAEKYSHKSIAEQRSVDVAWDLLLLPQFSRLRASIYQNKNDYTRFRYLVVNGVMATDIFDKQLKQLRDSRWVTAFHAGEHESAYLKQSMDRKATIVIEHIIQASDVAHTMQHFFIYSKWNERLFKEMYFGYLSGRFKQDPTAGWYDGELWFFDNYVIPLARKLKECAVFGVSSDEYLNYALQNRSEWERKGKMLCELMKVRADKEANENGLIEKDLLAGIEAIGADAEDTDSSCDFSLGDTSFDTSSEADFEDIPESIRTDIQEKIAEDVRQALKDSALAAPKTRQSSEESSRAHSTRSVKVPPGKLGIVVDISESGPVVQQVSPTSPLKGRIYPGDRITKINGIEIENLPREEFAVIMASQADKTREFVIESE